MRNIDLECVPGWRYCNIPVGEKGPRTAGWQNNPMTLNQINSNMNIGVLLGPISGGLVALDFDGASAWSWFEENIGCELPDTVMWRSGKADRCQMAFMVPEKYWAFLKTQKITTGDNEVFEFRWTGCQSVLPPSTLKDGRTYTWLASPAQYDIPELPEVALIYWLLAVNPEPAHIDIPQDILAPQGDEIVEIYQDLKRFYPELGYDRWSKATWVICRELGPVDGLAVMQYLYPEQHVGEYKNLLKGSKPAKPATMGSVITWIRERNPEYKRMRNASQVLEHNRQLLQAVEEEITRRKNDRLKSVI
jgi:hypothetical protein